MYKIKTGNYFWKTPSNQELSFESEAKAIEFLFTNGYCFIQSSIGDKWHKRILGNTFEPCEDIEIVKCNSEFDITEKINGCLLENLIFSDIHFIAEEIHITDWNGEKFVMTISKSC